MNSDAFSNCHPAVNFIYFLGAIVLAVFVQHPAYIAAGIVCSACYYLLLKGRKGLKTAAVLVPLFAFLTAINPLFNTYGQRVLFTFLGRPYTLEALLYGMAISGVLVEMLLWFGCWNAVLTSDKFTSLFGSIAPAISLLLVMVLRMVPNFIRKGRQLSGARMALGKGTGAEGNSKEKIADGMLIIGALTSWALEGGVTTSDSMRARGYGTAKRSSFNIYRFTGRDSTVLSVMLLLFAVCVWFAVRGAMSAEFTPVMDIRPVSGLEIFGFAAYCAYLLLPSFMHIKEALQWRILRSKI